MSSELSLPKISLVIPAWNEAACLPRLLDTVDAARKLYRHGSDRIEVIVADNESTDETPQIAAARGCHVEHVPKRLIAAARNGGAGAARGDTLAFAARKIGSSPAPVLNSSRKWDKHGDWHMFPDVVRGAF